MKLKMKFHKKSYIPVVSLLARTKNQYFSKEDNGVQSPITYHPQCPICNKNIIRCEKKQENGTQSQERKQNRK